jgi:hypothetical protein
MNDNHIPGIDPTIPPQNAMSVYSQDAMDDFPVLKAFQQYIDAEQAKARKRLLSLGIFFGILTGAIIAVFVVMLLNMTVRNQQLNDRLVEFAMKDRDRQSAVVVQPPQDNSAIVALTAKLDELQKKLDESRAKAEKEAAVAAERARREAAKPKGPTPEELEIKRLTALLNAEREKAAEKERIEKEKVRLEKEKAAESGDASADTSKASDESTSSDSDVEDKNAVKKANALILIEKITSAEDPAKADMSALAKEVDSSWSASKGTFTTKKTDDTDLPSEVVEAAKDSS